MRATKDIIRGLRDEKSLTQKQVANYLATTQQKYSSYETGRHTLPSQHIPSLVKLYKTNADYILGLSTYRASLEKFNQPYCSNCSLGEIVSNLLALDESARNSAKEYIDLLLLRQKSDREE